MRRVGWTIHSHRPSDVFEERGELHWRLVRSLLGDDTTLQGKRILDFGCGAGRILLPALADNPEAEFWACDVHEPSVTWLSQQVADRANVFRSPGWPPVDAPSGHFDAIYAFSVFTHLTDSWSAWLVELHRLLNDDGLLIITVFGPGQEAFGDDPVREELIGMNVLFPFNPWDRGGPLVAHSEWWIRAHWGRAFDIVTLQAGEPGWTPPLFGQGLVVMRKKGESISVEELERRDPADQREVQALLTNVESLRRELGLKIDVYEHSRSWRLTALLRRAASMVRSVRRFLRGRRHSQSTKARRSGPS